MTEFQANRVNRDDKKLKGLQNKGIVNFDCDYCDNPLLVLQLTSIDNKPSSSVLTRVSVKCCVCNCFSSVKQISGQFHPGAPNDNMAFDVLDDDEGAPEADVLFKVWRK